MTTFNFYDKSTGEYLTIEGTIADAEEIERKNPSLEWLCSAPLIHSGTGMGKPDDAFRDKLREIKKQHSQGLSSSTVETF